jgi:transposase
MARPSQYPLELRRRAVRMVAEVRPDYDTEWAAMKAVAQKLGIGTTETLRKWVRQDQVDAGARPGGMEVQAEGAVPGYVAGGEDVDSGLDVGGTHERNIDHGCPQKVLAGVA